MRVVTQRVGDERRADTTFDEILKLRCTRIGSSVRGSEAKRKHLSVQVVVVATQKYDVHLGAAFLQRWGHV
jgi:hypothetical protein